MHIPKPFKDPSYTKNNTRRTQTLKTLLSREKERDKAVRTEMARRKGGPTAGNAIITAAPAVTTIAENNGGDDDDADGEDKMDIDDGVKRTIYVPEVILDEDDIAEGIDADDIPSYFSIEAPPSFIPLKRYCDITGLEGPYKDPKTGLRYHNLGVYNYIQGLNPATIQAHLSTRGATGVSIK
ncbi:chromatin-remodeling complex subunit ies6 [Serendipita sp. 399]|nr:chromatin-remodeling complex subunit ies6 [Serendipita sp. 399]